MDLDYFSPFFDDDGVYSKTQEQHCEHLQTLFSSSNFGLFLRPSIIPLYKKSSLYLLNSRYICS